MELRNANKSDFVEKLHCHSIRLWTIRYCLSFLLYCFENGIFCENMAELYCFGEILKEYLNSTKNEFDNIEEIFAIQN